MLPVLALPQRAALGGGEHRGVEQAPGDQHADHRHQRATAAVASPPIHSLPASTRGGGRPPASR